MLGKGNYSKQHDIIHTQTEAKGSILIVLAGNHGHGMSVKADQETMKRLPAILRYIADNIGGEIEDDMKQIAEIKGEPNAKSTTEDSGPQSFAG